MKMGDLKSLLLLWENLAQNQRYQHYVQKKDLSVFRKRVEHEGLPFLTITLPGIGRALDNFHATTVWKCPSGFASRDWFLSVCSDASTLIPPWSLTGPLAIPEFLGNAIKFALSGDSLAVDCVRQLTYVFYKLEGADDGSGHEQFLVNFRNIDSGLVDLSGVEDNNTLRILDHMKRIISRVLGNSNPRDIRPCHGGGSTACRTENFQKWYKRDYYAKLDAVFDYSEYFFFSPTHLVDDLVDLEQAPSVGCPRARVVLVPKDSRGPRVISCEPSEMMYIQQGLMNLLYETIENHPLTSGQINFTDQSINRNLAYLSSIDGKMATIDLKDASDRVSLSLIRRVFPENWVECLEACRSEETILPDGVVVKLNKFAPMGSSCCFPVEALVFWACAQSTLHLQYADKSRSSSLYGRRILSPFSVYVYGDDIITPSHVAGYVMEGLELIDLKVNREKSFVCGPFRESCGGDYHIGMDVTPVRLKKNLTNRGTGVVACADFLNSLIKKFGVDTLSSLILYVEEMIGYVFPRTELSLPGTLNSPPRISNDVFFRRRFNNDLQRYEHRVLGLSCLVLQRHPPCWEELLRKELQREHVNTVQDPYSHWSKTVDASLDPGEYADTHSAFQSWGWAWLG